MQQRPAWLEVLPAEDLDDPALPGLDSGERSALSLALALKAGLIPIDDRKGAAVTLNKRLDTTGTLGVLDLATDRGLVNLVVALDQLKRTNFRYRQELFDALLKRHEGEGGHP